MKVESGVFLLKIKSGFKWSIMTHIINCYVCFYVETQPAFTCPKLTIETPEQCVKSVQSYSQRHQSDVNDVVSVAIL